MDLVAARLRTGASVSGLDLGKVKSRRLLAAIIGKNQLKISKTEDFPRSWESVPGTHAQHD
jgi:hypothetical protein